MKCIDLNEMKPNGFSKKERISGTTLIDALFSKKSQVVMAYPFRFNWMMLEPGAIACQVLVISSKKKLKKAVDRNRQKRQLRELYRINKNTLCIPLTELKASLALSIMYVGVEPLDINKLTPNFIKALQKIAIAVQKNHTIPVHPAH